MKTLIALLVWTAVLYSGSLQAGFVYEDQFLPTEAWRGWSHEWATITFSPRSLSTLAFRLQASQSPKAYHAVNVGLHLVCGTLVYALVLPYGPVAATVTTALWLIHTLGSEAVLYVSQRTDLIASACLLLMLLATRLRGPWNAMGAVGCGLLALWAKESAVVLVFLLPLWLWYEQRWSRLWTVAVAIGACAVGLAAIPLLRSSGSVGDGVHQWNMLAQYTAPAAHGPFWFASVQCAAVWRLLALIVWPSGFTVDHDWDLVSPALALTALAASLLMLVLAYRGSARHRTFAFCVFWIVFSLAPRFVVPLPDYVNEHQFYLSRFGPFLLLGVMVQAVCEFWSKDLGSIARFASEGSYRHG